MSAYIASLNREMKESASAAFEPPLDLRQRFIEWHRGLPEVVRHRAFAMAELEQALGAQGKHLSALMLGLGWVRRRKWSTNGQYSRYWIPPDKAAS